MDPGIFAFGESAKPFPTPLSLSDAIHIASRKNPLIAAAQSQVDISAERITQARSGFFSQLNFAENYRRTNNPMWAFGTKLNQGTITQQDFDPDRLNDPDPINNFASTFSANWPLFDSGQTWYGLRQAKLGKEAAASVMERTRQQVIAETVTAYLGALLAKENLAVIHQTLETARANLKMIASRFKSGFIVKSDLLRAQVRESDLEQQRLQAESQIEIARAILNAAMGVAIDNPHELSTPLEPGDRIEQSLKHWVDTAIAQRADLEQLKISEMIAREEISKSRAAHLPSLNLVGNYEINSEDFSETADNYNIGAVLNLNLFSGYSISAKIREAEAALKQVNSIQQDLRQQILVETRQGYLQAQSAWKRIQVAQAAVQQAEEAMRIVANRYQNGLLTILDLLSSEAVLQQACMNYFQSVHDYKKAKVQLELAAGTLSENYR